MERKRNPAYLERRKMLIRHFLGQSLLQNAFEEILKLDVSYFLSQKELKRMKNGMTNLFDTVIFI